MSRVRERVWVCKTRQGKTDRFFKRDKGKTVEGGRQAMASKQASKRQPRVSSSFRKVLLSERNSKRQEAFQ